MLNQIAKKALAFGDFEEFIWETITDFLQQGVKEQNKTLEKLSEETR